MPERGQRKGSAFSGSAAPIGKRNVSEQLSGVFPSIPLSPPYRAFLPPVSCDIQTTCPEKFYELHTVPMCYLKMFYKLAWAWAWV